MTASEIKALADAISQNGAHFSWVPVLISAVLIGIAAFLGTYLGEKAKNTATKEDIAQITHLIEGAKIDYSSKIESLKGSYHLRAVALERRLEVHQKAFAHWRRLVSSVHTDKIGTVCSECEAWWTDNCVYLSSEARDAFWRAMIAAHGHGDYLRGHLPPDQIKANWNEIIAAGNAIMKGADLPPLPSEALPASPGK